MTGHKASGGKAGLFWALAIVLMLSPIALAELYLRDIVGLGDPILYRTSRIYGYAPEPNQHIQRRRGAWITIDGNGLRTTTDWHAPAAHHILFIGDSVTWAGTNVDDHDSFAELTCVKLGDAICANAGVNSYGTDNMTARLASGEIQGEDTIVATAIAGDPTRGMANFMALPFYSKKPHGPFKALWEAAGIFSMRMSWDLMKTQHWENVEDEPMADRSLENLFAELRRQQAAGRRVLLVFSPYGWEMTAPESAYTKHIRKVMAQSGLDFLDMTDPVHQNYGPDFYVDGIHLDVRGHRVYAEAIAARLAERYKAGSSN